MNNTCENLTTYPCRKRGCPPDCPKRVVFRESPYYPYTVPMHEDEYREYLARKPDKSSTA